MLAALLALHASAAPARQDPHDDRRIYGRVIDGDGHSTCTKFQARRGRVPPNYRGFVDPFSPRTARASVAIGVEVNAAEDRPNVHTAPALEQRFTIVGRIGDESGAVLRVPVWLEWASIDGEGFGHQELESRTGRFAIQEVTGEVGVLARAQTDQGVLIGMTTVRVTSRPVRGVYLRLAPPARVRGRVIVEGAAKLPDHARPVVLLRTRWPRIPCLSDVVHKAFPENYTAAIREDGAFEFDDVVGERLVEVAGLPDAWRVKEVRRRGRVLPAGRLMLRPRDLISEIEIFIATTA